MFKFLYNHGVQLTITAFAVAFVTAAIALALYPGWRKKARRAMRRGMVDAVSTNPFAYVPIAAAVSVVLASFVFAGTKEADWTVADTEIITLSKDAEILPHTDEGVDLISVIDNGQVYVFLADNVDYDRMAKHTEMVVEHMSAFLRPSYERVTIR
jgi:hypothetical protein